MTQKLSKLHPAYILATWIYSGKSPKAPGTFGSLATIPFFYIFLFTNPSIISAAIISLIIFIVGIWASNVYMEDLGKHDPGEIVIDEVIGQFATLAYAFYLAGGNAFSTDYNIAQLIVLTLLSFGLFRLFDIFKPYPISWFDEKLQGGFGVMFDDVLAAVYSIITLFVLNKYLYSFVNL